MKTFKESIQIAAAPERVFEFIKDGAKLHEVWPSLVEVKDLEVRADGSPAFNWTFKMAGLRFHGRSEATLYRAPEAITYVNTGGIPSTFKWTLSKADGQTTLTCEGDYKLPTPILGRIAEALVVGMNEREFRGVLQNIKARCEHGLPAMVPEQKVKPEELRH